MSLDHIKLDRIAVVTSAVRIYATSEADFSDCLIERLCAAA
jgi:predicted nucleic-acid-binding protein